MKREKLTKEQVEKIFWEYTELLNTLVGLDSKMNEKDRLQAIRSFGLGYKIVEHYYLHDVQVTERDGIFVLAEESLKAMKRIKKQNTTKNKKRNKK